jgi:hypothetical protein
MHLSSVPLHTDYRHTKARSQILCSPNSNTLPNKYLGVGYEGLDFCRHGNMAKELTVPKWVLIASPAEDTPNVCPSPKALSRCP